MHEPDVTDDNIPVVETSTEFKCDVLAFAKRVNNALSNYVTKIDYDLMEGVEGAEEQKTLLEWLDDFQEFLTLEELQDIPGGIIGIEENT